MAYEKLIQPPILLDPGEYPGDFCRVAELIGHNEACSLLWYLPAFQIRHIPSKPAKNLKKIIIKRDYDGYNAATLAVRLNMLYRQVKTIASVDLEELDVDIFKNVYIAQVAEKCGTSVASKLLELFPGQALHIPRKGKNIMIQKLIKKEFSGNNQVALAVKYGLSIACIYRFLKKDIPQPNHQKDTDDNIIKIDGIHLKQMVLF